jgi:type VI secretion system protein ImpK
MTVNNYLTISIPLLTRCKVFLMDEAGKNVSSDFRDHIVSGFVELEKNAEAFQLDPKRALQLKYILSAFIDEVVMCSAWPDRAIWMGRSLQLQFFGEHLAGEGFFERLHLIQQSGHSQGDLLEVCYWCLQFGFQGKYRFTDQTHLLTLQASLFSQIETTGAQGHHLLAPAGLPAGNRLQQATREIPFWVIGVVTTAILYFIYFAYCLVIDAQTKTVLQQIQQLLISFQD